jgi:hypothetical protein
MSDDPQHIDAHLVPVRVKAAVGRPESGKQASGQIKPEFSGVPALEQAIRRTVSKLATKSTTFSLERSTTGTVMPASRPVWE